MQELHRKQNVRTGSGGHKEKDSDTIKARKGVVKMLIASVVVYVVSYAPTQIPLFYNALSRVPFAQNWSFLVLVMTLGYINSAANPILYIIFSQKFRQKFIQVFLGCLGMREKYRKLMKPGVGGAVGASEFSESAATFATGRGGVGGAGGVVRFATGAKGAAGGRCTQTSALMSEC